MKRAVASQASARHVDDDCRIVHSKRITVLYSPVDYSAH